MLILIDQDTKVEKHLTFLGRPCATPIGATLMALKTGATIVPMFTHLREDYKLEINWLPANRDDLHGDHEADLIINTQKLNDAIERNPASIRSNGFG